MKKCMRVFSSVRTCLDAMATLLTKVEARLSRSLRTPSGHNGASQGVRVASSNLFYATQPLGVRGGVDFGYAGDVRRVRDKTTPLLKHSCTTCE
jgi:acetylglutamate kinase